MTAPLSVLAGDRAVPLRIRRNRRARRLILRIDAQFGGAVVTLPPGATIAEAKRLATREAAWIAERLAALPPRVPFADGALIPILNIIHRVRRLPGPRRPVRRQGGEILVRAGAEDVAGCLSAWLRREAVALITPRVEAKAAQLGKPVARIAVRDTRSRWGSCSPAGRLSFCWRLVMAPVDVLDYVVAHEVAHLAEPSHDERFWRTVAALHGDARPARRWLRRQGPGLHRYG